MQRSWIALLARHARCQPELDVHILHLVLRILATPCMRLLHSQSELGRHRFDALCAERVADLDADRHLRAGYLDGNAAVLGRALHLSLSELLLQLLHAHADLRVLPARRTMGVAGYWVSELHGRRGARELAARRRTSSSPD